MWNASLEMQIWKCEFWKCECGNANLEVRMKMEWSFWATVVDGSVRLMTILSGYSIAQLQCR